MASQIILKKSSITARVPVVEDLAYGELALNYADGLLYYKKSDGTTIGTIGSALNPLIGSVANWAVTGTFAGVLNPTDVFFKPDGTKMFLITGTTLNQYTLSTPWDITTAGAVTSFTNTWDTVTNGMFISPDGTKLITCGQTAVVNAGLGIVASEDRAYYLTLSTAWDITSATLVSSLKFGAGIAGLPAAETAPHGITFNDTGTIMYMIGTTVDAIYQYTLSTAYNVSTATYSKQISVALIETGGSGIRFNIAGTRMYIIGSSNDNIVEYRLSTAWDIATAVYYDDLYIANSESTSQGLYLDETSGNVYIVGTTSDLVTRFNTNSPGILIAPALATGRIDLIGETRIKDANLQVNKNIYLDGGLTVGLSIVASGNIVANQIATSTSAIALGGAVSTGTTTLSIAQTTGTIAIGGVAGTGAITLGQSTAAQTLNLGTGATAAATTKVINIGTTGVSTSITNINLGSDVSGALNTVILNGTIKLPAVGTSGFVKLGAGGQLSADTTTYATGTGTASGTNTGDNAVNTLYSGLVSNATHTGDVTGSTTLTLATVNANVGTWNNVTVNGKGLVTAGSNTAYLTAEADTLATVTGRGSSTTVSIGTGSVTATVSSAALNFAYNAINVDFTDAGGSATAIAFGVGGLSNRKGAIAYERKSGWGLGDFHFLQNTVADSSSPTLAMSVMTIKSAGNVGIGTSSPAAKLDIRTSSASTSTMVGAYIYNESTTTNTQSGVGFFNYDNFSAKIYSPRSGSTAGILVFGTNAGTGVTESNIVERMRITSTGGLAFNGAANYGSNGQVLQSNGDASPTWVAHVTSIAATTPIVTSAATGAITLSHATSGVTAGTYNNVTVNATGHVTAGSNTAYLTALTDTLATVTGRGATTSTASTFSGGLTATGLTVSKSGTDSLITFPAQTNDPGYIKHYESNNAAIMYFSVSDDTGAADYFSFGSTPGGTYAEGLRLTAGGVVSVGTWQASSISTTYTDAKITSIAATTPIVASASTGAVTLSHATSGVSAGTYNNVTVNTFGHVTAGSNTAYLTDAMRDRGSTTTATVDTATLSGFYNQVNTGDSHSLLVFNPGGSTAIVQQRFHYGGSMEFRNKTDSATWNAWKTVLTSSNYNSYSPTLTGTGASGTWGISITGNSATATTLQTTGGVSFTTDNSGFHVINAESTASNIRLGAAWNRPGIYNGSGTTAGGNNNSITIGSEDSIYFVTQNVERGRFDNGGNGFATTSFKAPIFYDSNNPAYYGDFASTSNLYDLHITGASQKYLYINPGNGYEAMVRYNGGSGSSWYVGKRTASQTVGTESFHFYSEAASKTVAGIDTSGNMVLTGSLSAITKSFLIDHPTKPGMQLRYGSLEGPENGVYVRGRLRGNKIELPEYWTKLVDPDSITVNLTAIGKSQDIYVEDIKDNVVYVGGENINCFYTVFAERVDTAKLEVEVA